VQNLLGIAPGRKASEVCVAQQLLAVPKSMKLDDLFNLLIRQKMHMALVVENGKEFAGVATLEDIMEEILKTELEDKKPKSVPAASSVNPNNAGFRSKT
jgi:CBS domain containing-hemolysin-like protein